MVIKDQTLFKLPKGISVTERLYFTMFIFSKNFRSQPQNFYHYHQFQLDEFSNFVKLVKRVDATRIV